MIGKYFDFKERLKKRIMSKKEQETIQAEKIEETNQNQPENVTEEENTDSGKKDEPKKEDFEAKFREVNDKYLRLYSEFDNYRRRTAKEKIDLSTNGSESMLKALIPVLDDFERAITNNEKSDDLQAIKEGVNLVFNKYKKTLTEKGLKEMDMGDFSFNVDLHEAITKIPAPSEDMKGKIVDVVEKGYLINDKVIRYAKVVVGE